MALWWHGPEGTAPDLDLLWRAYVRRFDLEHTFRFLKQGLGMDDAQDAPPGSGGQVDVGLVVAAFSPSSGWRARMRRGPEAAVVAPLGRRPPNTDTGLHRAVFRHFWRTFGHARQAAETLRQIARVGRKAASLWQGPAYPALKRSA